MSAITVDKQSPRSFGSIDEFERACFPHARAKRLHDQALRENPSQHIADAVIDRLLRRQGCSICAASAQSNDSCGR